MARLPVIGSDADNWGGVLNEFLRVSHHEDGSLRGICGGVSVRDFGAKGNGLSDDTAAIQAAIDVLAPRRGTLCFPPGTYHVTALLVAALSVTAETAQLQAAPTNCQYTPLCGVNHAEVSYLFHLTSAF